MTAPSSLPTITIHHCDVAPVPTGRYRCCVSCEEDHHKNSSSSGSSSSTSTSTLQIAAATQSHINIKRPFGLLLRRARGKPQIVQKVRKLFRRHQNDVEIPRLSRVDAMSPAHTHMTPSPTPPHFHLVDALPLEIQHQLLDHLPIKTLCRGLAQTSRYWRALVDEHARRVVNAHFGSGSTMASTLMFEAQRPIDTMTHKHALYFSHFDVDEHGIKESVARFGFIRRDEDAREERGQEHTQAFTRGVPESHLDRLRPQEHTSSVFVPSTRTRTRQRSRSQSDNDSGNHTTRYWNPDDAGPHSQSYPSRAEMGDLDLYNPLDAYDWAGPLAARIQSRTEALGENANGGDEDEQESEDEQFTSASASPPRTLLHPTYRMQLDPLDSFETWILTLTLCISTGTQAVQHTTMTSKNPTITWDRRIAEGLDRVYRDWFQSAKQAALHQEYSKNVHYRGVSLLPFEVDQDDSEQQSLPPPKRHLEIDSPSIQVTIQPHPISLHASPHPALLSTYSHTYLSSTASSLSYSTFNTSQRVELRFHVQDVVINTARLAHHILTVHEDMHTWKQDNWHRVVALHNPSGLFAHRGRARGGSAESPGAPPPVRF